MAKKQFEESWKAIFKIYAEDNSFSEPIDLENLANPDTEIHKLIVFIYSLDFYIHEMMYNAAVRQERLKIEKIGPFAFCINYIIKHS